MELLNNCVAVHDKDPQEKSGHGGAGKSNTISPTCTPVDTLQLNDVTLDRAFKSTLHAWCRKSMAKQLFEGTRASTTVDVKLKASVLKPTLHVHVHDAITVVPASTLALAWRHLLVQPDELALVLTDAAAEHAAEKLFLPELMACGCAPLRVDADVLDDDDASSLSPLFHHHLSQRLTYSPRSRRLVSLRQNTCICLSDPFLWMINCDVRLCFF